MNKILLTALCGILLSFPAGAQNGWLPPVTIPPGADLCDDTPWKLVFFDDFNGSALTNQWLRYETWDGMPGGDNDNWNQAHGYDALGHIWRDENVIVGNGICRLLLKNESYSWHCDTCSYVHTENVTSGYIQTPYYRNGQKNSYNSGKFEAKIKFPVFPGSWCAFWLYRGKLVTEIDIAEPVGMNPATNQLPKNTANLHNWGPKLGQPNPYNLPGDTGLSIPYPNQDWWNIMQGNYLNQADWHTYTCEWDTTCLRLYLDHNPTPWRTVWKYYREGTIYYPYNPNLPYLGYGQLPYLESSTCNPNSGTWNITVGFPYDKESECNIRISSGVYNNYIADPNSVFTLGEMDVDSVRAWQRHPEGGHTVICNIPDPVLSGPAQVCDGAEFTASPSIPNGYWSHSSQLALDNGWVAGSTAHAAFHNSSGNSYFGGWVSYNYSAGAGCPLLTKSKYVYCRFGELSPIFIAQSRELNPAHGQFHLFVPEDIYVPDDDASYTWDLDYAIGATEFSRAQHARLFGRYAATDYYTLTDTTPYCIRWKLTIAVPGGDTTIRQGERYSYSAYGRQSADTNLYFADALITDTNAYYQAVHTAVGQTFMAPDADTVAIRSMIEKVRDQELAPYIVYPDTTILPMSYAIPAPAETEGVITGGLPTQLYPNPANDLLFIAPGSRFTAETSIKVHIYSLSARMLLSLEKPYLAGTQMELPLRGLSNGAYILELQQGTYREQYKFIKNAK